MAESTSKLAHRMAEEQSKVSNGGPPRYMPAEDRDGWIMVLARGAVLCIRADSLAGAEKAGSMQVLRCEAENKVRLSQSTVDRLAWVAKAAPKNDVRPELNSVYFHAEKGTIVATDGHRLHAAEAPEIEGTMPSFIIDAHVVTYVLALIKESPQGITVEIDSARDSAKFTAGDKELYARTVDARYPDYLRVIPHREEMEKIPANIPDLAREHKKRAKFASKKPAIRYNDGNGNTTLDDGFVIAEMPELKDTLPQDKGVDLAYAEQAWCFSGTTYVDKDKLLIDGVDRTAVIMHKRR